VPRHVLSVASDATIAEQISDCVAVAEWIGANAQADFGTPLRHTSSQRTTGKPRWSHTTGGQLRIERPARYLDHVWTA
jgi:hypothetical protein